MKCMIFFGLIFISQISIATKVVNAVIGNVGDRVVTLREARILEQIDLAKISIGGPSMSDKKMSTHDRAILEAMVFQEALNLSASRPAKQEVDGSVDIARQTLQTRPEWQQLKVSDVELQRIIEQRLTFQGFMKFKIASLQPTVSDSEAKQYFEQNQSKFGSGKFTDFKDNIKVALAQQQLENRLREWFELLRRKYKVRSMSTAESKRN